MPYDWWVSEWMLWPYRVNGNNDGMILDSVNESNAVVGIFAPPVNWCQCAILDDANTYDAMADLINWYLRQVLKHYYQLNRYFSKHPVKIRIECSYLFHSNRSRYDMKKNFSNNIPFTLYDSNTYHWKIHIIDQYSNCLRKYITSIFVDDSSFSYSLIWWQLYQFLRQSCIILSEIENSSFLFNILSYYQLLNSNHFVMMMK